mgnify:CR=1 FL=1
MASWMIHLRIADKLLDQIPNLSPVEFIMGNIAPDSGVPNEDWSAFKPSTKLSHFRKNSGEKVGKNIDITAFTSQYFTPEMRKCYDEKQNSFYLGYLTHLLTDVLWADQVALPSFEKFIGKGIASNHPMVNKIKDDWYDLDFLYLKKHPGFRAFRVYLGAVGFRNTYMDIFSEDAFDNRREYITGFYLQENTNLDREYPYLTEAETDRFVENSVASILIQLDKLH